MTYRVIVRKDSKFYATYILRNKVYAEMLAFKWNNIGDGFTANILKIGH